MIQKIFDVSPQEKFCISFFFEVQNLKYRLGKSRLGMNLPMYSIGSTMKLIFFKILY